ncbi:hypothetical protein VTN49DRAFT_6216 [Thermomyces lanuginosus]|uniref:uncharacterized protein n=1 Tax=Thermomyces lanuginosus TaxID=5541 RepID=UPI0037447E93
MNKGIDDSHWFLHATCDNTRSVRSRPDITYAVRHLQIYQKNATLEDWKAAKKIVRYLKTTKHLGLVLGTNPKEGYCVYTDTSHQDHPDGKSTEGYMIIFASALVAWNSAKQSIVAPSTSRAEYMAYDKVIKEALIGRYPRP